MDKVKIYGAARSCSDRCLWAAEEAGVSYELIGVDLAKGEQKTPAFLAVNPNGHVPALLDGEIRIFESFAINLYLAQKAGAPFGPQNIAENAVMTMWSIWCITELEGAALDILLHTIVFPPEKRDSRMVAKALAKLEGPLKVLNDALSAGQGVLVEGRFTAADLNVATVVSYLRGAPGALDKCPEVSAWLNAAMQRPAYRKTMPQTPAKA